MEAVPRTIRNKWHRRTPVKFFGQYQDEIYAAGLHGVVPNDGTDGIVHVLRCLVAEADLLMAIDGYPTIADLHSAALMRS
jgi:hypothetical protein